MQKRGRKPSARLLSGLIAISLTLSLGSFISPAHAFSRSETYTPGLFRDVSPNAWYASAVEDCYEFGLMKGSGETAFSPDGTFTLAEAATLAARIHDLCQGGSGNNPLTGSVRYQGAVDYCHSHGISLVTCSDYTVTASRLEMAALISSALPDSACAPINHVTALPDLSAASAPGEAVYRLYRAGILTGGDDAGSFAPLSPITRAEVAAIVARCADPSQRKSFSLTASSPATGASIGGMTSRQASDYLRQIAATRPLLEQLGAGSDDTALYTTLFNTAGDTALWFSGLSISDNPAEWPNELTLGNRSFRSSFNRIFQWDGTQSVSFTPLTAEKAYATLHRDGLEVFTLYDGTDVDGECWDSYYSFQNGHILTVPSWCQAWAWIYEYKLDEYGISAPSDATSAAQMFFSSLIAQGTWPQLPFDYSTIAVETYEDSCHATVTDGTPYNAYYRDPDSGPSLERDESPADTVISISDISRNDGHWLPVTDMERILTLFAQYDTLIAG